MPRTKNPNPFHDRPELAPTFQTTSSGGQPSFLRLRFLEGEIEKGPNAGRLPARRLRSLARLAFGQPIHTVADRLKLDFDDVFADYTHLLETDFEVRLPQQLLAAAVESDVLKITRPGLATLYPTTMNLQHAIGQFANGKTPAEAGEALNTKPGTFDGWLRWARENIGFDNEAALVAGAVITQLYNPKTQQWVQAAA